MSDTAIGESNAKEQVQGDNIQAFYDLLNSIEQSSSDARDKGTRFENLILDFLQNDPTYKNDFAKVQTYADWAQEHTDLVPNKKDIGIDLVATNLCLDNEPQTYTAIQCKFYAKDAKVPKKEIDSFLAASDTPFFTGRMIVATNSDWSGNAKPTLASKTVPCILIDREQLAKSNIDWSKYSKDGSVVVTKRDLRPYQQEALQDVISKFKNHDRGKLIMACGTGKTYTSLKIAEAQTENNGFVLFLVPSLALLSQTLSDWKQQSEFPIRAFAVCSDNTVGKKTKSGSIDNLLTPNELNYPATTNEQDLAKHVQNAFKYKEQHQEQGMVVIFSTYQSLEVIALAQNNLGMRPFDLVICDEAHRTAGGYLINPDLTKQEIFAQSGLLKDTELSAINADNKPTQATTEAEQEPKAKTKSRKSKLDFIDDEEAVFTRIHNDQYIHAKKRLYMTATPKIYGDAAREQKDNNEVVLYSMENEDVFGPPFHSLNFSKAVQFGCLVDYKVIILASDSRFVRDDSTLIEKINEDHAARIIGSWKALNKYGTSEDLQDDAQPMKRAVGFAQVINRDAKNIKISSKLFAEEFDNVIDVYRSKVLELGNKERDAFEEQEYEYVANHQLTCDCKHIDGSMNANEKGALLQWLREEPEQEHCKILFNVRCLSEGVDVPALDAVIFLSPRKSQVEIVQTVGRVMRCAPGKKRGYVILPLVVDNLENIDDALSRSDKFSYIWQVLKALRSINPDDLLVDGALEKLSDRIEVVCVNHNAIERKSHSDTKKPKVYSDGAGPSAGYNLSDHTVPTQGTLMGEDYVFKVENTIKSAIIKKVGNRREWVDWAKDVAKICINQVNFIKDNLYNSENKELRYAFNDFKDQLSCSINGHKSNQDASQNANEALFGGNSLSDDEVIEMLSQHIVIKPVLDALFKGYAFTENNPIAKALTDMLEKFDDNGLLKANKALECFYHSVAIRMRNVNTLEERQSVIVDLFNQFFNVAFSSLKEKLGIVYTPIEVVDFINRSANDILKQEFGQTFADPGVHVLDPFTGTGTFITRLMQSEDLIPRDALPYKYFNELHAFELVPLAYYVASINMEAVYQEFFPRAPYAPNNITVLTDTFALHDEEVAPIFKDSISKNTSRRKQVDSLDLRVIIGNPPYSAGQKNANDNNKNDRYLGERGVDTRVKETYVKAAGKVSNKNSLYDSYIKAFRWASDKLGDHGIIAFITNAGWLNGLAANGMRKCLTEEFNSIYIFNLKGKIGGSAEETYKEGGNVFDVQVPVAITILVKNPACKDTGKIFFGEIEDNMSKDDKLNKLRELGSITKVQLEQITPDEHNDWLNLRRNDFGHFITIDGKKTDGLALFNTFSCGIKTNRDPWSYNASPLTIENNFNKTISFYNSQVELFVSNPSSFEQSTDKTLIAWGGLLDKLKKGLKSDPFDKSKVESSLYRPFIKQFLYNEKFWIERTYQMPKLFPYSGAENLTIGITGVGSKDFSCLVSDSIACFDCLEKSQWLPRYVYTEVPKGGIIGELASAQADEHGYVRSDGINPEAVQHFKDAYPEHADKVDVDAIFYYIYGVLHSPEYRSTYANNLQKELARIPRVATYEEFAAFEKAGRALAELHVNYEAVKPYDGCLIEMVDEPSYRVKELAYGKIKDLNGKTVDDHSTIIYNSSITIKNIPIEAQEYVVNKKSALDWIIKYCCVSTNEKSGISNDFNDYVKEIGDEKYIFNLILRVITVSLETMKIVKSLPKLNIHPLDK